MKTRAVAKWPFSFSSDSAQTFSVAYATGVDHLRKGLRGIYVITPQALHHPDSIHQYLVGSIVPPLKYNVVYLELAV